MDITYVAQEEKYGCALAVMAMILGISYQEMKSHWNPNIGAKEGVSADQQASFMFQHGWLGFVQYPTVLHTQEKRDRSEWVKPFAPIHIVGVITENGSHALLWIDDKIYDPNRPGIFTIDDYPEVMNITGYWKINN